MRLNKSLQTNDFEFNLPIDEQMDNYERRRLLYVAATRAKDHLVVSLHRAGTTRTNARLLADAGALTAAADGVPFPAAMWCASLWGGSKARPLRRGALVPTCAGGG